MGGLTFIIVVAALALTILNATAGKIPKEGREGISEGKEITAVIVNENKTADRSATMKLEDDNGRKYQVKMSPTEAHLWIKGDRVKILISKEDEKKYRVLFNDYFRHNEDRLRQRAKEMLEKRVNVNFLAARFCKYTKESLEAFKKSKLESQRIFVFVTLMKIIDVYTVLTGILAIGAIYFVKLSGEGFKSWLIPGVLIGIMVLVINSAVKTCVKIKTEAEKSA